MGQGTNPEISRPCINSVIPKRIEHLKEKNIINISCGESHSIVVVRDKEEEIFCWGSSKFGQLGLGELLKIDSPQKMKKIWEEDTISVGCGKSHSLFLTKKKEVYGCGETRNGGLGNLKGGRVGTPILIDLGDIKGDLCEVFAGNDVSGILFK